MSRSTETPVLFLIFNRLDTLKRVFNEIRKAKPRKLFIAADGPRKDIHGEKEKCEEARKITESIDWKCDVKRLYRNKNLGCRKAVSSAIDWFFESVDEGIILEDDCLPDPTFFRFCEEMLYKYRDGEKVMHIGGNNFQKPENQSNNSYYFSKYSHIWGWATWRRAWKKYDVDMKDWLDVKKSKIINTYFNSYTEKIYWQTIFDVTYKNKIDTWDYQWLYTVWKKEGLCINPGVNLVENIGFGRKATHWGIGRNYPERGKIKFPIRNSNIISFDRKKDFFTSRHHFKSNVLMLIYLKIKYML